MVQLMPEARLIQMNLESITKVKDNLMKSQIVSGLLNPFECVRCWFGFLHDFIMLEGFEKVKVSRSNLIGSFANLRYQLFFHDSTLWKHNSGNFDNFKQVGFNWHVAQWFTDRVTSWSQLKSGSDFNKRWQRTHLSEIFGGRGNLKTCTWW